MIEQPRQELRLLDQTFGEWVVRHFSAHLKKESDKKTLREVATAASHAAFLKHSCLDLGDKPLRTGVITDAVKPLVISADGRKVWLQKYHVYETAVAEALLRLQHEHRLEIITGGPGTGKTWTAAQRIRGLRKQQPSLRIHLAAPTGKAANNMMAALNVPLDRKATTLHALLGIHRGNQLPRYHHDHPLPADMVIIDEASMMDLPMAYHLLQALPMTAKLLLLGDKDQLASVEAGSVLHEICSVGVFGDCITRLTESRRYQHSPEIGVLAIAINEGRVPDMDKNHQVKRFLINDKNPWQPAWLQQAVQGYAWIAEVLAADGDVPTLLARQSQFQVLCALREGPQGVQGINAMIAHELGHKPDDWYAGRPVMIMQNDHERKLYNGDVGMVLRIDDALKACFRIDGHFKAISRAQMPAHETCYAMTVHKSQGSEYDRVFIVLPASTADFSPVLTRELVYTAVTRAKEKVDIWCGEGVLELAAEKTTKRMSGLTSLLQAATRPVSS